MTKKPYSSSDFLLVFDISWEKSYITILQEKENRWITFFLTKITAGSGVNSLKLTIVFYNSAKYCPTS